MGNTLKHSAKKEFLINNLEEIFNDLDKLTYQDFCTKYRSVNKKNKLFICYQSSNSVWKKAVFNAIILIISDYDIEIVAKKAGYSKYTTLDCIYKSKRCPDLVIERLNKNLKLPDKLYKFDDNSKYKTPSKNKIKDYINFNKDIYLNESEKSLLKNINENNIKEFLSSFAEFELDEMKIKKYMKSNDIMIFDNEVEFVEKYFDIKNKSWNELHDFLMNIFKNSKNIYSCYNVFDSIMSNYKFDKYALNHCILKYVYEDGSYFLIFISPSTLYNCKKECKLVGRLYPSINNPFLETAYNQYCTRRDNLTLGDFSDEIDDENIIVFDNKENFLDWYFKSKDNCANILKTLRNTKTSVLKNPFNTMDECILYLLKDNILEYDNFIIFLNNK